RTQANTFKNSLVALASQMKSLRNSKVVSASTLNSNILAKQLPENNEKVINGIYLATIAAEINSLDDSQASIILGIAEQCPYAGGKAVYRARTLYKLIDPTIEYNDDSTCFVYGIYRMSNELQIHTEQGSIMLIPNPASDNVTVIYQAMSDGPCGLYVTDITGKVL